MRDVHYETKAGWDFDDQPLVRHLTITFDVVGGKDEEIIRQAMRLKGPCVFMIAEAEVRERPAQIEDGSVIEGDFSAS